MHLSLRRVLVFVALAVVLAGLSAVPILAAAGPSRAAAAPAASSEAGSGLQLWSWMRTIWPDAACGIDPSGQCLKAAPGTGTPAGAAPAPRRLPRSGKVRPTGGCGIDSNGGCA